MQNSIPTPLLDAAKKGKCILFVGSGLSVAAGLPNWKTLIAKLIDEVAKNFPEQVRDIKSYVKTGDLLTLAEFARSKLSAHEYATFLSRIFDQPIPPHRVHKLIARTAYRAIITTNYDRLLETAITFEKGRPPNAFTSDSISSLARALSSPDLFLFKLHGDTASPETIILTAQDYDRLTLRSLHVRSFLQSVFLNYTIFFVGYSLSDPDFQLVLKELTAIFQGYTPQHYALIPNQQEFTTEYLKKSMNIQAMIYEPQNGHAQVEKVLSILQKAAPLGKRASIKRALVRQSLSV
ncbi:MAG: SIR2 family protein [candidate division KSB1 bacterium]